MISRSASLCLAIAALAVAGCNSGGGLVVAASSPHPSSAPTATPSATISPSSTTPTAVATATATVTASASPSSTPANGVSPTPTATATSTAASSTCPGSSSAPQNQTWTLNGSSLTFTLPAYNVWTGTQTYPANSPSGTVVSETISQNNFNFAPTSDSNDPTYAGRTKDLFMSFMYSQATTFTAGAKTLIPVSLVSTCLTSGTTYYVDVFDGSTFSYTEMDTATSGMLTVNYLIDPNPFPAGTYINVILSH